MTDKAHGQSHSSDPETNEFCEHFRIIFRNDENTVLSWKKKFAVLRFRMVEQIAFT